eukprot:TRINITY_DN20373_c0_g1_i1.p1 TRINITY_DN20373_c0_g1~~TRINITY_DN20373_c0_g1_i1.p1  ORF type:complete len:332 (+),score=94.51 TRINITY_DN20373_c0_g1_i1:86-1081(+)
MAKPVRPGGFKNYLSDGAKEQKKKEKAELRKRAGETGSYLDAPVKTPTTETREHDGPPRKLRAALTTVQGWRRANEDAATVVLSLPKHPQAAFLGVYDGHGGSAVANCIAARLHDLLDDRLPSDLDDTAEVTAALRGSFVAMDAACHETLREDQCSTTGATCNVCILTPSSVLCGNAGDARAIMVMKGGKVVPLSHDHQPEEPEERARIERAGSHLQDGRIDGMLNVSRAMGDFDFKKKQKPPEEQAVTCAADVTAVKLTGDEDFIVQACDGIWGAKSNEEVAALVAERLQAGDPPAAAAEALCAACLAPTLGDDTAGTDNMSVNILKFEG